MFVNNRNRNIFTGRVCKTYTYVVVQHCYGRRLCGYLACKHPHTMDMRAFHSHLCSPKERENVALRISQSKFAIITSRSNGRMFHYLVFHTINWLNWASISCRIIDWCNRMLISMQLRCSLSISFILNWSQPLHAHRNTSFDYANKCAYRNTHAPTTSDVLHANETLLLTKWLLTHTHTYIL